MLETQVSVFLWSKMWSSDGVQIAKLNLCELCSVYMHQKFLRDYALKLLEFDSCKVKLF